MDLTRAFVIADSVNVMGNRLITLDLVYPAIVHHYVMSYSSFAKSSNDIRCLTPGSVMQQVRDEGFVPESWRRASPKGPVPQGYLNAGAAERACDHWDAARLHALKLADALVDLRVARELTNRLLEPFMWLRTVATADESMWNNFLQHRTAIMEQAEMRNLAIAVGKAIRTSAPRELAKGEWHIPFDVGGSDPLERVQCSVARCARICYRTPRLGSWGEDESRDEDAKLYLKLQRTADWSHFEHQAMCWVSSDYRNDDDEAVPAKLRGKFNDGWIQFRKTVSGEVYQDYKFGAKYKPEAAKPEENGGVTWANFSRELFISLEKAFATKPA